MQNNASGQATAMVEKQTHTHVWPSGSGVRSGGHGVAAASTAGGSEGGGGAVVGCSSVSASESRGSGEWWWWGQL